MDDKEEVIDWPMSITWDAPTDIIITDPCYLRTDSKAWDEVGDKIYSVIPELPRKLDHYSGLREGLKRLYAKVGSMDPDNKDDLCVLYHMVELMTAFTGDLTNTDPIYWAPHPQDLFAPVGIDKCLCGSTIFGDWSCVVKDDDTGLTLGHFAADAGLYIVCPYDASRDSFRNLAMKRKDLATVVYGFKGTVTTEVLSRLWKYKGEWHEDKHVRLVGRGNLNFHTELA